MWIQNLIPWKWFSNVCVIQFVATNIIKHDTLGCLLTAMEDFSTCDPLGTIINYKREGQRFREIQQFFCNPLPPPPSGSVYLYLNKLLFVRYLLFIGYEII